MEGSTQNINLNDRVTHFLESISVAGRLLDSERVECAKLIAALKSSSQFSIYFDGFPEVVDKILEEVILMCPSDWDIPKWRTVLRLVSCRWNALILGNPRLWTCVYIDVETLPSSLPKELVRIRSEKERCGVLSPSLFLQKPAFSMRWRKKRHDPNLLPFIFSIQNWGSINIELDGYFPFVPELFKLDTNNSASMWTALRSLTLSTAAQPEDDPELEDDPNELFKQHPYIVLPARRFPALRMVNLEMPGRNLGQWQLPWLQLTSLTLNSFASALSDYLGVLNACRDLEEFKLVIDNRNIPRSTPKAPSIVVLRSLRSFVLEVETPGTRDILSNFLEYLAVPNLHHFEFVNTADGGEWIVEETFEWLGFLFNRSRSSLQSVSIQFPKTAIDDEDIKTIFEGAPSLRVLTVAARSLVGRFLVTCLPYSPPSTLETVTMKTFGPSEIEPRTNVARWVERCRGDGPPVRRGKYISKEGEESW